IDRAARREVALQHARYPVLELHRGAGADPDYLIDLVRVEPGLDPVYQRLGDRDGLDLAEHVVEQLHREAVTERADVKQILAHRAEQILARGIGLRRAADDDRELARFRPHRAAADRRVEHRDAALREAPLETPRRERVDR